MNKIDSEAMIPAVMALKNFSKTFFNVKYP